ncbi:hypothetical protein AAHA92_05246 [Salvia divinorum]|uniref:Uncharacterized protein n=1 Tax=Salvia divinorum TaxID=28513 RepID=A0ABD1I1U1_SALDI
MERNPKAKSHIRTAPILLQAISEPLFLFTSTILHFTTTVEVIYNIYRRSVTARAATFATLRVSLCNGVPFTTSDQFIGPSHVVEVMEKLKSKQQVVVEEMRFEHLVHLNIPEIRFR